MKYLKITSAGEIEPEALTLMGASNKRGDGGKIGMFGSGNKFSLAYLMRHGIAPRIFSGTTEIEVSGVTKTFRNEPFTVITINGQETSLTTAMGKDWDCWMAIREVFANALDEGDATISVAGRVNYKEGITSFFIPMNDLVEEFYENVDSYFSTNRNPIHECETGVMYRSGQKGIIYRKGIRVMEVPQKSLFDYDLVHMDITEDRTVKYAWQPHERIMSMISSLTDRSLINEYFANISDDSLFENSPSCYSSISMTNCAPIWDEVIKGMYFCPKGVGGFVKESERVMTSFIDSRIYTAMESRFGKDILPPSLRGKGSLKYKVIEEGAHFRGKINKAVGMCKLSGVPVDRYQVHVAEFSNKDVLGMAENEDKSIVLSDRVLAMGQKEIMSTIIEEYIHLSTGAADETRAFQDASINLCISMMEQLSGIEL